MNESKFVIRSTKNYREELFRNWPSHWPGKENHVIQYDVTVKQYRDFARLLHKRAGERELERFLAEAKEVLSLTVGMFGTGHHMAWIFPKEQVRPSSGIEGGLIPDYLLAGANSFGVQWCVLELKGADKRAFSRRGSRIYLSTDANRGVCQLINYIDVCSRGQAHLRDELGFKGLREPRGILLLGTDDETKDKQIREFKRAWNDLNPRIQIRSFSSLLRTVEQKLRDFKKIQ